MPRLKVITPANNSTILGEQITVSFIVGDLEIGREGHLHLWLDSDPEKATPSAYLMTHFDYTLSPLTSGEHRLALEVVKPDHQSFGPKVRESVVFKTQLAYPSITSSPIPKSELPTLLLDKTFIGLALGLIIVSSGILIRLMIKDKVD